MIVPDLNLLIYAHDQGSMHHAEALAWWQEAVQGPELIGIPWSVALGFIRLTTGARPGQGRLSLEDAVKVTEEWFSLPNVTPLTPGHLHLQTVLTLLQQAGAGGKLVPDAHLAALAIEHRATLYSHDRDFERFSGFKLRDPLRKRSQ